MTNLLRETVGILKENKKKPSDVKWCGSEEFGYFSWAEFERIAKLTDYDGGFGGQEIAKDLLVVGEDFWLERHEYDGSEWWEYKSMPKRPKVETRPVRFKSNHDVWFTLHQAHLEGGKYGNI